MVVCFVTPPYKPACFGMLCTPSRCGNFLHAPGMHSGYLPLNARCSLLCRVCMCSCLQIWLVSRKRVAHLACVLTGLNVMYYSLLWTITGDMAAPIMAAMLHAATECWLGSQKESI